MRPFWKGALSFGLIHIPVHLFPASEERALGFHLLHKKDLSPVRFARVCKAEEKEIPYEEIVKGYEIEKGEYIVVTEEDFKRAETKKTQVMDIQSFAALEEIQPLYFSTPYFLEPEEKAGRAYCLLKEALERAKKVAVVSLVLRQREHMGVIVPYQEGLALIEMRYHSELKNLGQWEIPQVKIRPKELEMALMVIEQMTEPFEPEKYQDTYTQALRKVIEEKVKGKKRAKPAKQPAGVPAPQGDLMALLKDNLQRSLKDQPPRKRSKRI